MDPNKNTVDYYVNGMDWGKGELQNSELSNYRKYQYLLISKYLGANILEVGSGDRSFTNQIVKHHKQIDRIISLEPSKVLFDLYEKKYNFPDNVTFYPLDVFDLTINNFGKFDSVLFIHVLEHIEKDKEALNKVFDVLNPDGKVLIEVPAIQSLFSVHDKILGHYRRYNKKSLKSIVDKDKFEIVKIWYQDPVGILGSLYFFKFRGVKINSESGVSLFKNQGNFYDKYIIPITQQMEKLIRFPLGLSLTMILKRKK